MALLAETREPYWPIRPYSVGTNGLVPCAQLAHTTLPAPGTRPGAHPVLNFLLRDLRPFLDSDRLPARLQRGEKQVEGIHCRTDLAFQMECHFHARAVTEHPIPS